MFTFNLIVLLTDFIFGFLELLLVFRVVLKFFGANSNASFVSWVYLNSQSLVHPFEGVFPTVGSKGPFTIEISSLIALLVFALVSRLVQSFVQGLHSSASNASSGKKSGD